MQNKLLILFVALFLSGCATTLNRIEQKKNQNTDTTEVTVNCNTSSAKKITKETLKEFGLVLRPQLEKNNFVFANTGYGNYWLSALFYPSYYRIGCFFKDSETDKSTTILITEEKLAFSKPIRYTLSDRIKVKSLSILKEQ